MRAEWIAERVRESTFIACTLLVACGTSGGRVYGPEGQPALRVDCANDRADCLEKASAHCGQLGYHVLEEDGHSGGPVIDTTPGPVPWWSMTVACGEPRPGYVPPPVAPAMVSVPAPYDGADSLCVRGAAR